jgi:hypothetical protein
MKKFITILMSCSLALAAGALAQQDEGQQPTPKKKHAAKANAQPDQEAKPAAHPPRASQTRAHAKVHENMPANPAKPANAQAHAKAQAEPHKKGQHAAKQAASANETAPVAAQANPPKAPADQKKPGASKRVAKGKKPDVQAIKAQHANFHAQPKPKQAPAVTFSQSRRIEGSDRWQGEKYTVFRSYRPEKHDRNFYRSHYSRVELISGGYYYWNAGYWYPAWGYSPSESYYAYDGPIYVGQRAEPPDQVIADVQAALQEMGYYHGEVDGLLGPLTREALTGYQSDNGLYTTAAIDEPTLASLGMG